MFEVDYGMIVYEFYLKDEFKAQAFDALCDAFYKLGNVADARKVDRAEKGSAVYAVSRNPATNWVQLLVDDNVPKEVIGAIEARIQGLCDTKPAKYSSPEDHIAPPERPRNIVGV
jgi:hypothetical protein